MSWALRPAVLWNLNLKNCGESKGERLSVLPTLYISLWGNFSGAANMEFEKILCHKLFYRLIKNGLCVGMPCRVLVSNNCLLTHYHKIIADTLDTVTIAHRFASSANYVKDIWQNFTSEMRQAWCMMSPSGFFIPSCFTRPWPIFPFSIVHVRFITGQH